MELVITAERLEALGNPTRLAVYRLLVRAGAEGLPVGQLQARTGVAPSTLSHHLKTLVTAGLVLQKRQGTTLICHADYAAMNALIRFLVAECCADGAVPPRVAPDAQPTGTR